MFVQDIVAAWAKAIILDYICLAQSEHKHLQGFLMHILKCGIEFDGRQLD
jgi:hypothetical protein